MKKTRFLLLLLPTFLLLSPTASNAENVDALYPNYNVMGEDLRDLCERNKSFCELWIQGVIEGTEFSYTLMMSPERLEERNTFFCLDSDPDYLSNIRKTFVTFISKEENSMMLKRPAMLSLVVGLQKYQCR